jgi:flagellar M-ring protein FliF
MKRSRMLRGSEAIVQELLKVWMKLNLRRQVIATLASAAVFLGVIQMSRMATAPSMELLYAGLESGAAGDVVRSLEQRDVVFEVRGGSIFVNQEQRDELRLSLASEGLPENSTSGYELLDTLTGFGTTSQMFDATYWRAKEGELARTIVASPRVSVARVHIANTGANPFQRAVNPKASVSLTPIGGGISSAQAKAVRYLVASAVAGLSPDDVAIIDANGTLVGQLDDGELSLDGDDKAQKLRHRAQRMLEARVGFGNAIVEVSVDTITESESVRERTFDPESRVAISSDTEERTNTSKDGAGNDVTVASNLPDQEGAGSGEGSSSQNNETRERVNYEVSEVEREIIRSPGAIKRISVAVLVNDTLVENADGEVTRTPRTDAELAALRDLVATAVGFDESRGDIITMKSMALQSVPPIGTNAEPILQKFQNLDFTSLFQTAILAIVTVFLGLFVVRPILSNNSAMGKADFLGVPPTPERGIPNQLQEIERQKQDSEFDLTNVSNGEIVAEEIGEIESFSALGVVVEDPVERLRSMISERQDETVEILRGWLEEKEEKA